jgi:hypothetical protein
MAKTLCPFCNLPNKITNEHIWARWIGPFIGIGAIDVLDRLMGETKPTGAVHRLTSEVTSRDIRFGSSELSHKVKAACSQCNTGWMSALESDIVPILSPMICSGAPIRLTRKARTLIAAWATKTAMVCEYLGSSPEHPIYFTPAERRWVMEKRRPPQDVHIWIGHCDAPHAIQGSNLHLKATAVDNSDGYAYLCTHAIGHFAFQIFSYRAILAKTDYVRVRKGPWEESLFRIWPQNNKPVVWPPPLTLRGNRWDLFCERIVGFADPPPRRES